MSKKPTKTKSAAAAKTPPATKTSKLKLILLAGAPLVLAGGGYAGWMVYAGGWAAGTDAGVDSAKVAAIPPEVAAETSFTYSFALSELLKTTCGQARVSALKAASEAEARADGTLVNLSWMAASRRVGSDATQPRVEERRHEQHEKNEEQHLGEHGRHARERAETECRRDERDDEKHERVMQHGVLRCAAGIGYALSCSKRRATAMSPLGPARCPECARKAHACMRIGVQRARCGKADSGPRCAAA